MNTERAPFLPLTLRPTCGHHILPSLLSFVEFILQMSLSKIRRKKESTFQAEMLSLVTISKTSCKVDFSDGYRLRLFIITTTSMIFGRRMKFLCPLPPQNGVINGTLAVNWKDASSKALEDTANYILCLNQKFY